MRIFVTGASGFIGSEFCRQATSVGHDVLPLQRPYRLNNLPYDVIISFSPDVVVHCAWIAIPGVYTDSPENFVLQKQSVELFQWLSNIGVKHFVGCGSCAEYAPSTALLDEDHSALDPASPYARAKHALRTDLEKMAKESSLAVSWARIFYPYGPSEHPDRLISRMLRGYETGDRIVLRTPDAVRDYIHVVDVASALLVLVQKQAAGIFNIGTGVGVPLAVLQDEVAKLSCKTDPPVSAPRSDSRVVKDAIVASTRKLRALGWGSRYQLSEGLVTYLRSIPT
ncbi:MAG: NAD(P)-dependent oxidoreductase [Verrucomicrobia bacterium]|nr:NAD(P)-dependent oxidoreductase [Verrucomicrobiota bacterium]